MRVMVLGGSPKGEVSVTMQYVAYLTKRFPDHTFDVRQVAQPIRRLERNEAAFDEVIDGVRNADIVLWAFPLYILLVCSQYKRFIELIFERDARDAFAGKYAASLSTSINYYDITAHNYMRSVSEDLGMEFVGFYSANMNDLRRTEERNRLTRFALGLFDAAATHRALPRRYAPLPTGAELDLASEAAIETVTREAANGPPVGAGWRDGAGRQDQSVVDPARKRIIILTDEHGDDPRNRNLRAMTARLASAYGGAATLVNLNDLDIKGGCTGCLKCGQAYECIYEGKDAFVDFYRSEVMTADIIVIAGTVTDRQLSWKWRQFLDRSFFNTHTPVLTGKQVALLVAGPLSHMQDLQQVYEAWFELQEANLVDFVSDEDLDGTGDASQVFNRIDSLAAQMTGLATAGYVRPRTFLGIAGLKIFRDDIFGHLRIPFPADHAAYRKRGYYNFPTRNPIRHAVIALMSLILRLPFMRKGFVKGMRAAMVGRYRSVLESTVPYTG